VLFIVVAFWFVFSAVV